MRAYYICTTTITSLFLFINCIFIIVVTASSSSSSSSSVTSSKSISPFHSNRTNVITKRVCFTTLPQNHHQQQLSIESPQKQQRQQTALLLSHVQYSNDLSRTAPRIQGRRNMYKVLKKGTSFTSSTTFLSTISSIQQQPSKQRRTTTTTTSSSWPYQVHNSRTHLVSLSSSISNNNDDADDDASSSSTTAIAPIQQHSDDADISSQSIEQRKACFYRNNVTKWKWTERIELDDLYIGQELRGIVVQEKLTGTSTNTTTGRIKYPKLWLDCGIGRYNTKTNVWSIQTAMIRLTPSCSLFTSSLTSVQKKKLAVSVDDNNNKGNNKIKTIKDTVLQKKIKQLKLKNNIIDNGIQVFVSRIIPQSNIVEVVLTKNELPTIEEQLQLKNRIPAGTLKNGMIINGTVVRVENYGILINVNANRNGLLHIQNVANLFNKYINKKQGIIQIAQLSIGTKLKVQVISNKQKRLFLDFTPQVKEIALQEHLLEAAEQQQRQQQYNNNYNINNNIQYSNDDDDDDDEEVDDTNNDDEVTASDTSTTIVTPLVAAVATAGASTTTIGTNAKSSSLTTATDDDEDGDDVYDDDDEESDRYDEERDIEDKLGLGFY